MKLIMDEVASVDTSAFSTIEDTLLNLLELIPINLKFIYFYILKKI
jgi:competence protein ComGF